MIKYILVADDNMGIFDIASDYLTQEGYVPIYSPDGVDAIEKFKQYKPVLVLLDIMMPKKDGIEVCKEIRRISDVPVIMITAKNEDADIVMGLDNGADDYVVKPFSFCMLMARIRAVLRRIDLSEDEKNKIIKFQDIEIDISRYRVLLKNKQVSLTKKEIEIIWLLASNKEKVFTRDNLIDSIWGPDYYGDPRCVDTHIKRIRSKLKISYDYNWNIKTIWGVGYKFEVNNV